MGRYRKDYLDSSQKCSYEGIFNVRWNLGHMYFNPFAFTLVFPSAIMLFIAFWVLKHRNERWIRTFAILAFLCGYYSLTYAMELSSITLELMFFWVKVEYIAIAFIPALLLLFALDYSGLINKSYSRVMAVLALFPLITLTAIYTNHYHYNFHQEIEIYYGGLFPVIIFERGFLYLFHSAYVFAAFHLALLLFIRLWLKAREVYRTQVAIIIFALLIPWASTVLYFFNIVSRGMDLIPYALSASCLLIFWGIVSYQLFDLLPAARARLFEDLQDGVLILDNSQRIVDFNSAAQEYLAIPPDAFGKPAVEICSNWPRLAVQIKPLQARESIDLHKDAGEGLLWFKIDFSPLQEVTGTIYGQMIIIREDPDRILERYRHLAETDDLTGLWNRRHYLSCIEKEFIRANRYKQVFSLLMLDIDHFKNINDCHGHYAGDITLQKFALLLKNRIREADILARLGGDEFGLLLPNTDQDSAYLLAESIREMIALTPFHHEDKEVNLTVSIGISTFHAAVSGTDDLLKVADEALYRAKEEGRNYTAI